ncbi:putative Cytochrome P450 monooxygenase [Seiridium cardinale]|uniref:Cytochrome P450 monooxygenase n=1 Tax=Seiridium cardinale TaxID=138064 RepID=A0ABR2XCC5_9PEZI
MAWYGGISSVSPWHLTLATLIAVCYGCGVAIYRLYFSPLARFPGPKLAAITTLYAAYHDVVRGGQYVWVIEEMHRKYGPVVRIRPDALHVNDPNFIEKLYPQSHKHRRERYKTMLQTIQADGSVIATRDHDLHRKRRAVLNPYFSQANVRRLEPIINDTLTNLLRRMDGWAQSGEVVHMNVPFRAATKDIIQSYALGDGKSFLDMEDCNAAFFDVIAPNRVAHIGTYCYWFAVLLANLPPALMMTLIPKIGVFATYMQSLAIQIEEITRSKDLPEGRTIFHEIHQSNIPESEKAPKRLADEAMVLLVAGSETTASTLAAIMYHLLADRHMLARLKSELESVMPDPDQLPVASKLDALPFLNALIQEAIRLYPGATHRQDRVAPDEDLSIEATDGTTFVIPAGTAFGMTAPLINRHPGLYENPTEFRPDRYLENPGLVKYQFSFSKGARQCVGMNLAYQELQSLTAGIFRRYEVYDPAREQQSGPTLELFETKNEDVAMYADYITISSYPGSQGLRVRIRN